jgi:sucrose-6-phosphate hydrolase SacC (GH32 family)
MPPSLTLRNPVWRRPAVDLRDPAVLPVDGGYHLFYTHIVNDDWSRPENISVARAFTRDFTTFEDETFITPGGGFASPGDPIRWHGRWLLPYQSYPVHPARLFYSTSPDALAWSSPIPFLPEANDLPWNLRGRAIDPNFVVAGDALHCFFVGSCWRPDAESMPANAIRHANLVGHAVTRDPELKQWEILTPDEPLLGISPEAPDGCENVMVIPSGGQWTMVYSEGLAAQHLAVAQSSDLLTWRRLGPVALPMQGWMQNRYGAPFIWREADTWWMILMGEDAARHTSFGLLTSPDGIHWDLLPE